MIGIKLAAAKEDPRLAKCYLCYNKNQTISSNIFTGNKAARGGAIYANVASTGITNNTFNSNVATGSGGALYLNVNGNTVTLYADGRQIFTAESTVENMGELDRDAVWIGEQLTYDISGPTPRVCVVPGLRFTAGPVLVYDEMPAITASIHFGDNGLTVDGFKIEEP